LGCAFLDAGIVVVSTKLDGIHLDASEQIKLGKGDRHVSRFTFHVSRFTFDV